MAVRALAELGQGEEGPAARLQALLDQAERITRRERSAHWWRRHTEAVESAWRRVETAAAEAFAVRRETLRTAREAWPEAEAAAEAMVGSAGRRLLEPGLRGGDAARLARAVSWLDLGRWKAAAGRLEEAIELAERSRREALEVEKTWTAAQARFHDEGNRELWLRWTEEALAEASRDQKRHLVVDKMNRLLHVYAGARLIGEFEIELGSNGLERKLHSGDRATPEGRYRVTDRRGPGRTRFHRALLLDYPNAEDLRRWTAARRAGQVPTGSSAGGLIEIHGMGGTGRDWTDGCVALRNRDMDRLFEMTPVDTPVTIVGTYERADSAN